MKWFWRILMWSAGISSAFFIFAIVVPSFLESTYSSQVASSDASAEVLRDPTAITHLLTPEPLKALYMTACVAGTPSWREELTKLIEDTELNAIVVDIKDYTGSVSFKPGASCFIADLKDYIRQLHEKNIYVIGRIAVFQDPLYTKLHPELAVKSKSTGGVWKDRKGLSFIDVGAKDYWDYIISISKEAYEMGFDELNFDYVRYPSDGNMEDTNFTWTGTSTKPLMLKNFFEYLNENLHTYKLQNLKTSVDLFGMTTTVNTDMGIGQILEYALPYFDYVAPMVYPSHYPNGWNNFLNPAEFPYEVVKIAMSGGMEKEKKLNLATGNYFVDENGATTTPKSKLRTWVQDFNLGATYDAGKVRAEINATYDVGLTSWMLWNAGNKYTKEALLTDF